MKTCDQCRELIWDELYGLLEPEQSEALSQHLALCPECGAELAKARAEQMLVAEAARLDCSIPPFALPSPNSHPIAVRPALPPKPGRIRAASPWLAAAAAIAVAVGLPQAIYRVGLDRRDNVLRTASLTAEQVANDRDKLEQETQQAREALERSQREKELRVQVTGPADLVLGESGRYRVRATSGAGQTAEAEVVARLRDNRNRGILFETREKVKGEWAFDLPADLPAQARTTAQMEVVARGPDGPETVLANLAVKGTGYTTHVAIDRRVYRPGDTIFFRSLTLRSRDLIVPGRKLSVSYQLLSGKKTTRVLETQTGDGGISGGELVLPTNTADGEYTLIASSPEREFTAVKRRLLVRSGAAQAKSHDQAAASKKLQIEFFPEGGDLIAGVESRVYFRVQDATGRLVEFHGRVVDGHGHEVARLGTDASSPNVGLGSFTLKPQPGETYHFETTDSRAPAPGGDFPDVRPTGYAVVVQNPVARAAEPVALTVSRSGQSSQSLIVAAFNRDRLVAYQEITLTSDRNDCRLNLPANCSGVVRIALLEQHGSSAQTVAERAIYRIPAERLNVSLTAETGGKSGDQVDLHIRATDEQGRPKLAWLLASVVDQAWLNRAGDASAQSPKAFFYLTSEIDNAEDFDNADFLVGSDPRAGSALDLFLGTYGWRSLGPWEDLRFATAVVQKDNSAELERKSRAEMTAALALLQAETDKRDDALTAKGRGYAAELHQALIALKDYQIEAPRILGRSVVALALAILLTALAYGGIKRWRAGAIPRAALAGVCAAVLMVMINSYWFTGPEQPLGIGGVNQLLARLDKKLSPMVMPVQTPIAPIRTPDGGRTRRKDSPNPLRLPDQTMERTQSGTRAPAEEPPSSQLQVRNIREYSVQTGMDNAKPSETIYWHPMLFANDGGTRITLKLPSATSIYRVRVDGHSVDGRLGSAEYQLGKQPDHKGTKATDMEKKQ
jgi:hypothetical protein